MAEPYALIDTDVLIELLRDNPKVRRWLEEIPDTVLGLPILVYLEALMGARTRKEATELKARLREFSLHELMSGDSAVACAWFEQYHLSHGLGILDCLIGAIARREAAVFYTFNVKHYRCFDGLDAREPYQR
jgi:predicted nucleic acid-binding protein